MLTKAGAKSLMSVIRTIIGILWDLFPDAFPEAFTAQDTYSKIKTEKKELINKYLQKTLVINWLISIRKMLKIKRIKNILKTYMKCNVT